MTVERRDELRMLEALLFAASEPLDTETLAARLDEPEALETLMNELARDYAGRGVNIVNVAGRWALRTAPDLAPLLETYRQVTRRLSRAAIETLAIVAYHQPVTRAEIEEIRGVALSRGTLDLLFETGWVRPRGRRRTPGRPMQWGTTDAFLAHFGLHSLDELPGLEDLKSAGLLSPPDLSLAEARPPLGTDRDDLDEDADADEARDGADDALPFAPPED